MASGNDLNGQNNKVKKTSGLALWGIFFLTVLLKLKRHNQLTKTTLNWKLCQAKDTKTNTWIENLQLKSKSLFYFII